MVENALCDSRLELLTNPCCELSKIVVEVVSASEQLEVGIVRLVLAVVRRLAITILRKRKKKKHKNV